MKDYDAIARELNLRMPCEVEGHENDCPHPHVLCSECCERRKIARDAAILRKHDEAEASGEHPMALPRTLAGGVTKFISIRRDSEGDACGWNFETEKAAQWIAAQLAQSRPAPTDKKALRGEWLNAKTNPPRDAKKQVCINRNGGAFFARYAGGDWLDDDAFLRDPVLYISIPLLAREAPKDQA